MSNKCLEFVDDYLLEKKAAKFGKVFWAYNLPLQIWRPNKDNQGSVLLYMPRKESCVSLTFDELFEGVEGGASEENIQDFCDVAAAIQRNLADQFIRCKDKQQDYVYYPNEELVQ